MANKTKKPTIRDVALRAGVSLGTASRVINGSENVGVDIRRRVERAIEDLGFEPNTAAQSIRGGSTRSIGLVLRDIVNSDFADLVRSVQRTLQDAGYTLLLACHGGDRKRELDIIQAFTKRRVDGVIVGTYSDEDKRLAAQWSGLGVPIVLYDQERPEEADAVLISHHSVMADATKHLLMLGHRRIAFITGQPITYPARSRLSGFLAGLAAFHVQPVDELVSTSDFAGNVTFGEVTRLLEIEPRPTAILLGGIEMLPGAIKAIRAKGLSIPDDISLIGLGESDLSALTTPPISIVRWDAASVGHELARLLLDRLNGLPTSPRRRLMYEAELVVRGSCAPPKTITYRIDEPVH